MTVRRRVAGRGHSSHGERMGGRTEGAPCCESMRQVTRGCELRRHRLALSPHDTVMEVANVSERQVSDLVCPEHDISSALGHC